MEFHFVPDIIKKQYDKIITNIYRIQSIDFKRMW